jgi:hypothetical protein
VRVALLASTVETEERRGRTLLRRAERRRLTAAPVPAAAAVRAVISTADRRAVALAEAVARQSMAEAKT